MKTSLKSLGAVMTLISFTLAGCGTRDYEKEPPSSNSKSNTASSSPAPSKSEPTLTTQGSSKGGVIDFAKENPLVTGVTVGVGGYYLWTLLLAPFLKAKSKKSEKTKASESKSEKAEPHEVRTLTSSDSAKPEIAKSESRENPTPTIHQHFYGPQPQGVDSHSSSAHGSTSKWQTAKTIGKVVLIATATVGCASLIYRLNESIRNSLVDTPTTVQRTSGQ